MSSSPPRKSTMIMPGDLVRIKAQGAGLPNVGLAGWLLFDTLADMPVIVPMGQSTALFLGSNNDPQREEIGAAGGLVLWESRILEVPPGALEVAEGV